MALGMNSAGIAVGGRFKESRWSEVVSNKYQYGEKRIHGRDLLGMWMLLAAVLGISALWSFL
jgi:hypothetical protein